MVSELKKIFRDKTINIIILFIYFINEIFTLSACEFSNRILSPGQR